ncbi:unnamed protein product [Adineta steineri]|uniref:SHSP domain-containing protein n=1 Tax=Adineta steineri TaxID=433720 RepID=A0A814CPU5_9BILA|nr:unnamed protein product [Adineta steineri]CAF0942911.1 unnamed protein product [Adineta steineri]CAF0976617.1 unnamed protein product [Adineta steineri]
MLVTSSQSSTQRPLGLSVEELFALDRQYRRIEQQQQHVAQLQAQARITSSNLNRLASRSLDFVSSPSSNPVTILPSLEIHGHGYNNRSQPSPSSGLNYPRSHSIDHLRYIPPPLPPPSLIKHTYPQRSTKNNIGHQHYQPKYKTYLQQPITSNSNTSLTGNSFMYDLSPSSIDYSDNRGSCKLRRQHPIKRESSRRIVVRPLVHRRREPSLSSSCESLDETRSYSYHPRIESNMSHSSVLLAPSNSFVESTTEDFSPKKINKIIHNQINNETSSDDNETNLYEMRIPIGKTYDTSDISVQLEGPKILIHCHTIEPTDKRGHYSKHELKTELFVPDVVDDETIVAYLTEDGELIVEGKYHLWAWQEIKKKRHIEQKEMNISPSSVNPKLTSTKNDSGGLEQEGMINSYASINNRPLHNTLHRIEQLENNRTVIHVGELTPSQQHSDTKSVSDIINRFNTLNKSSLLNMYDGQYSFTSDNPPILIYHLRLSFETLMDEVRVQSDPKLNILKIFIEQQEKNLYEEQSENKIIIRSTSRICRLPRDHTYDYTRLRVNFLKDNFIRIEIPTIN